jgi:hypothetical protein
MTAINNVENKYFEQWVFNCESLLNIESIEVCYKAFKAGRASMPSIPEGWALVPIEPTEEFLSKAIRKYLEVSDLSIITSRMAHLYKLMIDEAMLNAAPKPTEQTK